MAASQGGKSKSSTPAQKDRRAKSWSLGQKRKTERAERQRQAAARNREHRSRGQMTPWEVACEDRRQRRNGMKTGKQS